MLRSIKSLRQPIMLRGPDYVSMRACHDLVLCAHVSGLAFGSYGCHCLVSCCCCFIFAGNVAVQHHCQGGGVCDDSLVFSFDSHISDLGSSAPRYCPAPNGPRKCTICGCVDARIWTSCIMGPSFHRNCRKWE